MLSLKTKLFKANWLCSSCYILQPVLCIFSHSALWEGGATLTKDYFSRKILVIMQCILQVP